MFPSSATITDMSTFNFVATLANNYISIVVTFTSNTPGIN